MTSKISFSKLLREELHHRHWMMALSILMQTLMGPILFLLVTNGIYNRMNVDPEKLAAQIYGTVSGYLSSYQLAAQGIIAACGALIVGLWGFRHLFSRRMTDLYLSTPITRWERFRVNYVAGFLVWFVPALCSLLISLLIGESKLMPEFTTGAMRLALVKIWWEVLLLAVFAFLTIYHLVLIGVSLSGTIFNSLVNIGLLGFGVSAFVGTGMLLANTYFDTYVTNTKWLMNTAFLSPLISPVTMLFSYVNTVDSVNATPLWAAEPVFFWGSILMVPVLLYLAIRLYITRKAEEAEGGVENKALQAVLRTVNAVLAALIGGWIMGSIVSYHTTLWSIFGAVLCGALCYGVLEIIHQRSFRAFFSHKWQMIIVTVLGTLLFLAFNMDWFGFDTYLPSKNNILSASVDFPEYRENGSTLTFDEDGYPSYDYPLLKTELTDPELIYELLTDAASYQKGIQWENHGAHGGSYSSELEPFAQMTITMNKRHGGSYSRSYYLTLDSLENLRSIVETESYMKEHYPSLCGAYPVSPVSGSVHTTLGRTSYELDGAEAARLAELYYEDFREHYCLENLWESVSIGEINLNYATNPKSANYSYRKYISISLRISVDFSRTIAYLQEKYPEFLFLSPADYAAMGLPFEIELDSIQSGYRNEPGFLRSYYGVAGSEALESFAFTTEEWDEYYDSDTGYYYQPVSANADWSQIIPFLVLGEQSYTYYAYNSVPGGSRFIRIGDLEISGQRCSVFIRRGDMPASFADALTLERVEYDNQYGYNYSTDVYYSSGYYDPATGTYYEP